MDTQQSKEAGSVLNSVYSTAGAIYLVEKVSLKYLKLEKELEQRVN